MLAQTSRRTRRIVTKNACMEISVDLSVTSYQIKIRRVYMNHYTSKHCCIINILNNPIEYTTTLVFNQLALPCKFVWDSVYTYSADKLTALEAVIDFLVDSFQLKTANCFAFGRNALDNDQIVQKFKWLNLKPNHVILYGSFPSENMLVDFLDTYADVDMMRLHLVSEPSTILSNATFTNLRAKYFEVHGRKWMNTESLMGLMNCRRVSIGCIDAISPFTEEELSMFITKWLEAECDPKMLRIRMRAPKWNKLIRGIEGVRRVGRVYKIFKTNGDEAGNFRWRGGYFIFAEKAYSDIYLN
ncbi:hypothetical protein CAEBREN_15085 [Caenorhabditis brenneri]|uniref:F-box associated domain-containing protein n=1 Tax=Caenorhabditis brenneri TaxID=135651 RepID=G0MQI2_CAEBE|nr:hypothetical protein CAEBREN_15085 [Caenorhabditis brenneri]